MLILNQATKDAFERRQIRIHPILNVVDEAGRETYVSPQLLLTRPARTLSPLITKSPVMRLDLDIAPTAEMLALFQEERIITYTEIVNGQEFKRFTGRVHALDKGWALADGTVQTSLKVTCFSYSQALAELDAFLDYTADTFTASAGAGFVAMPVITFLDAFAKRAASGDDALPFNCVFKPHSDDYGVMIVWNAGGGGVAFAGTDFKIVIGAGGQLHVNWITTPPAAGTVYRLTYYAPLAFVFKEPLAEFNATTPAGMEFLEILLSDTPSVEAVDPFELPYKRYFAPSASVPDVYTRTGAGTGAPTQVTPADWEFTLERGYFRYVGTGAIFDDEEVYGGELLFVGVKGLAYPQESTPNSAERLFSKLYTQAGVVPDPLTYHGFDDTNITVAEGAYKDTGINVLSQLYQAVPPNYVIMDDENGLPRGRFLNQHPSPAFELKTVTGLKNKEAQELVTRLVVRSVVPGQPVNPFSLMQGFYNTDTDTYWGALIPDDDTVYAEPSTILPYLEVSYRFTTHNTPDTVSVRFAGELRVLVAECDEFDNPVEGSEKYLAGMQSVIHSAAGDYKLDDSFKKHFHDEDPHGRALLLRLYPTVGVAAPKLYHVAMTENQVLNSYAILTDAEAPADGTWSAFRARVGDGSSPVVGYLKNVGADTLKRWMLDGRGGTDPEFYDAWYRHRNKVVETGAVSRDRGNLLAVAYMDDVLRRATAQEVDVVLEPAAQIGDTVLVHDLATGADTLRLIVGFKDGNSWTEPSTTLELADFS